jgi:hypothetical protein
MNILLFHTRQRYKALNACCLKMIKILHWISNPVEDCKHDEADKTEDHCCKIKTFDPFVQLLF